jgi:hypothetical protein
MARVVRGREGKDQKYITALKGFAEFLILSFHVEPVSCVIAE